MPEPPKEGFFKGLFGGGVRPVDRDELCESMFFLLIIFSFYNAFDLFKLLSWRIDDGKTEPRSSTPHSWPSGQFGNTQLQGRQRGG